MRRRDQYSREGRKKEEAQKLCRSGPAREGEVSRITLFFAMLAGICAAGWLTYWVGVAALAKYMSDKGYKPPSDDEIKACSVYVWKKLLHLN